MKMLSYLQTKDAKENAWLFICASGLFLFHGLRDFFIVPAAYLSLPNKSSWNPYLSGLSLASCHFGIMTGYLAIPFLIGKLSLYIQLSGSLFLTGFFAMFILNATAHAWSLIIVRGLQGIAQSWIYVITYAILQEQKVEQFSTLYSLIFYMPWLGSAVGITIGCTSRPEVASFSFGALCILLAMGTLLLKVENKFEMGTKDVWTETLKSKGAICTAAFHVGSSLALHTFVIGLPCTLMMVNEFSVAVNWSYFVVLIVLVTGAFTRLFGLLRVWFIYSSLLSVLKRRKLLILGGVIITVVCLYFASTSGKSSIAGIIGPCLVGGVIGGSISISAARMCFHDLAPCFPIPILHIGNIAASFGAAVASLMFMGISGGIFDDSSSYNTVAWLIPAGIEIILVGQLIFFLSVDTLSHQFVNVTDKAAEIPSISFTMSPSFNNISLSRSVDDNKSFKSIRSALTFKTVASSLGRKPSGTYVSMGDLNVDNSTIWNSESGICCSIPPDKDLEMQSISSEPSYKSVILDESNSIKHTSTIEKSRSDLDRTYEWLNAYHMPDEGNQPQSTNNDEREKAQRNMLLGLQW